MLGLIYHNTKNRPDDETAKHGNRWHTSAYNIYIVYIWNMLPIRRQPWTL